METYFRLNNCFSPKAKILHLPALKRLSDKFEITAVCNHTEKKAREFSELMGGVKYYLDHKELLKDTHNYAMKSVESKILDQAANTKHYNIFDGAKSLFDISSEGG